MEKPAPNTDLLYGAYNGSLKIVKRAVSEGADLESMQAGTCLTALHLAVGRNHLDVVKYLIEDAGAPIKPDGFGRWPTVIAAQCRASDDLSDYIVECEAAAEHSQR